MRFLALYLRSRGAPAAAQALAVIPVLAWLLADAVAAAPVVPREIGVLAALLAVAAVAGTLGGADEALERTASVRWTPRRLAHVLLGTAAAVVALDLVALTGMPLAASAALARNVAGLAGLAALAAVLLGAQLAWTLPMLSTVVALTIGESGSPAGQAGGWLMQAAGSTAAAVTAAALAVTGAVGYALRGCRMVPPPPG